jgi:hypothetical protein
MSKIAFLYEIRMEKRESGVITNKQTNKKK